MQVMFIASCVLNLALAGFCGWQANRMVARIDKFESSPSQRLQNNVAKSLMGEVTPEDVEAALQKAEQNEAAIRKHMAERKSKATDSK